MNTSQEIKVYSPEEIAELYIKRIAAAKSLEEVASLYNRMLIISQDYGRQVSARGARAIVSTVYQGQKARLVEAHTRITAHLVN